ncbi:hypothetical protein H8K32_19175 [Undibacterium jejuense]|uniref:Uncharacterized protein n=1 Tax=Undibacterium jejuense TaxID=1344949 RepID=A0A923HL21_9BURK|nr:hypothetical protein [Undibacterium jejuense]MBC3864230.1 hypothetical protein [Undibacterium jejuense]
MTKPDIAHRAPKIPLAVPLALRLSAEELVKTDRYASQEVRSRSAFARMIFLRGLAEYERELATNQ